MRFYYRPAGLFHKVWLLHRILVINAASRFTLLLLILVFCCCTVCVCGYTRGQVSLYCGVLPFYPQPDRCLGYICCMQIATFYFGELVSARQNSNAMLFGCIFKCGVRDLHAKSCTRVSSVHCTRCQAARGVSIGICGMNINHSSFCGNRFENKLCKNNDNWKQSFEFCFISDLGTPRK
jgi:hypothetical protein